MTAPDLLPCPFCGCEPDGHEGSHVSCRCGAMGPLEIAGDPESPTWNTRATPAATDPNVTALVNAATSLVSTVGDDPDLMGKEHIVCLLNDTAAAIRSVRATTATQPAPDAAMRLETMSENIARDMREGRFPARSEPQMVPAEPAPDAAAIREAWEKAYWRMRSYAVHDNDCKLNKPPRFDGPCSCGLTSALEEALALITEKPHDRA